MCSTCLLIVFIESFINVLGWALTLAIFVRVILSWIPNARLPFGLGEFVFAVSEPILGPIRRAMPFFGGVDFSPLVALLLIQVASSVLLRVLPPAIQRRDRAHHRCGACHPTLQKRPGRCAARGPSGPSSRRAAGSRCSESSGADTFGYGAWLAGGRRPPRAGEHVPRQAFQRSDERPGRARTVAEMTSRFGRGWAGQDRGQCWRRRRSK